MRLATLIPFLILLLLPVSLQTHVGLATKSNSNNIDLPSDKDAFNALAYAHTTSRQLNSQLLDLMIVFWRNFLENSDGKVVFQSGLEEALGHVDLRNDMEGSIKGVGDLLARFVRIKRDLARAGACRLTDMEAHWAQDFISCGYFDTHENNRKAHGILQTEQRVMEQCAGISFKLFNTIAQHYEPGLNTLKQQLDDLRRELEYHEYCVKRDEQLTCQHYLIPLKCRWREHATLASLKKKTEALRTIRIFHDRVAAVIAEGDGKPHLRCRFALRAAGALLEERSQNLSRIEYEGIVGMSKGILREHFRGMLEARPVR